MELEATAEPESEHLTEVQEQLEVQEVTVGVLKFVLLRFVERAVPTLENFTLQMIQG